MGENRKIAIKLLFLFLLSFSSCNPAFASKEIQADSIRINNEGIQRFYENTSNGSNYVELKSNASLSGNVTFVLPTADGSSGEVLGTDGSGNLSFNPVSVTTSVVSKSTTYTATTGDNVILGNSSGGAWTLTLYSCSGNSGRKLLIKKTDSSYNIITVDGAGSETIDGDANKKLTWHQEFIEIVCDGSNWHVIARDWDSQMYAFTPAWNGRGSLTFSNDNAWIEKISVDTVRISWFFLISGGTGAASGLQINIPNSWTLNTSKGTTSIQSRGQYFWWDNSGSSTQLDDNYGPATYNSTGLIQFVRPWDSNSFVGSSLATSDRFSGYIDVPLSDWSE